MNMIGFRLFCEAISGRGFRFGSTLETKGKLATEGFGVYIAINEETANFFGERGQGWEVEYTLKNPLINNNEENYGFDPADSFNVLKRPIRANDSPWKRIHKTVVQRMMAEGERFDDFYNQSNNVKRDTTFNSYLTEEVKRNGYDGVHSKWGPYEWVVVYNPQQVKIIRQISQR